MVPQQDRLYFILVCSIPKKILVFQLCLTLFQKTPALSIEELMLKLQENEVQKKSVKSVTPSKTYTTAPLVEPTSITPRQRPKPSSASKQPASLFPPSGKEKSEFAPVSLCMCRVFFFCFCFVTVNYFFTCYACQSQYVPCAIFPSVKAYYYTILNSLFFFLVLIVSVWYCVCSDTTSPILIKLQREVCKVVQSISQTNSFFDTSLSNMCFSFLGFPDPFREDTSNEQQGSQSLSTSPRHRRNVSDTSAFNKYVCIFGVGQGSEGHILYSTHLKLPSHLWLVLSYGY